MTPLLLCLYLGAAIHFGILFASALTPRVLDWSAALAPLPKMLRQLFWVYGAFIVLVIVGFGTLTATFATAIADGQPLGRGLAAFIAVFWAVRLGVQCFVFDARPYLTRRIYQFGYHLLTLAFVALVLIFGVAAVFPNQTNQ